MNIKKIFIAACTIVIVVTNILENDTIIASGCFNLENFINCLIPEKEHSPSPEPDITNPGPDTASFPTSPFILPKGRGYFENFPIVYEVPNYHTEALLPLAILIAYCFD